MFRAAFVLAAAIAVSHTAHAEGEKGVGPRDGPSVFERTHDATERASDRGDVGQHERTGSTASGHGSSESSAGMRQAERETRPPRREDTGKK